MATFNLRSYKHPLLWLLPAVMLGVSLIPILMPYVFILALQLIVSLAAAYISYLLFTEKPKNYFIWGIVFVLLVLIFNPIMQLNVVMGVGIPLALIAALIFLANWWFVFKAG